MDKKEFFGSRIYDRKDDSVKSEELDAKIHGICFSAHWCPVPVEAYHKIQENGGSFEILFVSWGKTGTERCLS
jgi:hypothetical protein